MSLSNCTTFGSNLPTNYEYYTTGGIHNGLSVDKPYFTLNNKNISIYSGALHYFRVPRAYWRDSLRKIRSAGLNTVETYIPWNLHEPRSGVFDFGNGTNDMSDFLHLEEFLKTAKEEDLFTIVRTGPYICAEFEFGGFPSWLLKENQLRVRTSNEIFMKYVTRFFNVLLPILAAFQFLKGGPIIMFQVENEYANSGRKDLQYLRDLRQIILNHGIKEPLVTSDNPHRGTGGTIPDLFLMTGNLGNNATYELNFLKRYQPNKPKMIMEFWSGWFDTWGRSHNTKSVELYKTVYEDILKYPASVNIYMFRGGTNFGFMNGAENLKYDDLNTDYHSIVTSYEYDALLDESGNYTQKYYITKELLSKYNTIKTKIPDAPKFIPPVAYEALHIKSQISFEAILKAVSPVHSNKLLPMEKLDINQNSGQSYGYIVYRKANLEIPANVLLLIEGRVCDTIMVLINGKLVSPVIESAKDLNQFGTSKIANSTLILTKTALNNATLDLIVENWGRINVAVYKAFKGLWQGGVKINGNYLSDWTIYPLEFKKSWTNTLSQWQNFNATTVGPTLYKTSLTVSGSPRDTFVDMSKWTKGIVIVNGFVLGRFARFGPVQTLYLPAPLLKTGLNDIVIFEHFNPSSDVNFANHHIYFVR